MDITSACMKNPRTDEIVESSKARMNHIERMLEALTEAMMQQQRQQSLSPPPPLVQVEPVNNEIISLTQKFNKMKPPTFLGGIEPLKTETWILEIEKLFEVFPCAETQKVLLATYTLKDEAQPRWMLIRDNSGTLTWDQFREIFYEKYFPQCFQDRKVSEFQEHKYGNMSIAEYEAKFTELAQFAPHMVDTNYKKVQKFEGGLTLEVLNVMFGKYFLTFLGFLTFFVREEYNDYGLDVIFCWL
ncbi:uncharacterized protein LOC114267504 isoform X2 [Camellia sinensis]|uniref:uncharacterized protein LOC114267504 isoform X2 n=1 Tax=Camellia sinensis TaxID=4442 RepID=UPI00103603A4|nr:uncharacterized protein LOC114267504 isoform X2 [Camellia sinensis]